MVLHGHEGVWHIHETSSNMDHPLDKQREFLPVLPQDLPLLKASLASFR
jgi:hypothetical protein